MRVLTAVVCVRRMFFDASDRAQSYRYLNHQTVNTPSQKQRTPRDEPDGSRAPNLVHGLHSLQVILWEISRRFRFAHEERVVSVASRVLLRLKEGVEIPERRLNETGTVCWHLTESHLQEDSAELGSNLPPATTKFPRRHLRCRCDELSKEDGGHQREWTAKHPS